MTIEDIYNEVAPLARQVLQIPQFDSSVSMVTEPNWDSLRHVQLLSACERRFAVVIDDDEAFKLTSADKLVHYLHGALQRTSKQ